MDVIDLNFLNENEVRALVNVIEKDFELMAAEKSRLCRLRKRLITNDQRAVELSQTNFDGFGCVICFQRFIFLVNPKRICCSCTLQICNSCCQYMKALENYVCKICQQQKDLIAMNCSWFYENIRRKFMDGGSQIVANSLSDYPRKNLISPTILNMVKGTQITKFRHQVEEATRTIEESLIKVELSFQERDLKSVKYEELIQKFLDTLKQIFRSTSQVLYITLENYLFKMGRKDTNIDVEVFTTLHEEVELLTGKKIDVKMYRKNLMNGRKTEFDKEDILETLLAMSIIDKLLIDVQQALLEGKGKKYEDLNFTLQSMVKKSKYDYMDFDYESISQVPSRHGTMRRSIHLLTAQPTLYECARSGSDESLQSTSRIYSLSGVGTRSVNVSKQWNDLRENNPNEIVESLSGSRENILSPVVLSGQNECRPIDSDAVSMHSVSDNLESNWLMKARCPLGSLNSLYVENCDPYDSKRKKRQIGSNKSEVLVRSISIDEKIDQLYQESRVNLSVSDDLNIDEEYRRNVTYESPKANLAKINKMNGSGESQDSGIVAHESNQRIQKPQVPNRKSRIPQSTSTLSTTSPEVPKRKSKSITREIVKPKRNDSSSDSSVIEITNQKPLSVNQKRNLSDQLNN